MHFPAQFRSHSKVCTCVWEGFVSNSGQITDCSDWGSSSCYPVSPDNFKPDSDNFLQKSICTSFSYFREAWPRTGTIGHYFCCFNLQNRWKMWKVHRVGLYNVGDTYLRKTITQRIRNMCVTAQDEATNGFGKARSYEVCTSYINLLVPELFF